MSSTSSRNSRGKRLRVTNPYPGDVPEAMPEGFIAWSLACYIFDTLTDECVDRARDCVYANMPIYHDPDTHVRPVTPDAFFVRGVPHDPARESYRLFEPGTLVPQVVFEIVAREGEWKDVVLNREIYERLGVIEYYWFDTDTRELTAFELDAQSRRYQRRRHDRPGRFLSQQLGLELGVQGGLLALYRGAVYLPTSKERLTEQDRMLVEKDRAIAEKDRAIAKSAAVLRQLLLKLLTERFGEPPAAIVAAVNQPANTGRLAGWFASVAQASSLDQLGIET